VSIKVWIKYKRKRPHPKMQPSMIKERRDYEKEKR
jgi:hypothetical protein